MTAQRRKTRYRLRTGLGFPSDLLSVLGGLPPFPTRSRLVSNRIRISSSTLFTLSENQPPVIAGGGRAKARLHVPCTAISRLTLQDRQKLGSSMRYGAPTRRHTGRMCTAKYTKHETLNQWEIVGERKFRGCESCA